MGGHDVIGPLGGVAEGAVGQLIGQHGIQKGVAVFHKVAVLQVDVQHGQGDDGLGDAFTAGGAPGGKAAGGLLHGRQPGEAPADGLLHTGLLPVKGQGLEGHGGGVGVGDLAGQGPAAVGQLFVQQMLQVNGFGSLVAAGVF